MAALLFPQAPVAAALNYTTDNIHRFEIPGPATVVPGNQPALGPPPAPGAPLPAPVAPALIAAAYAWLLPLPNVRVARNAGGKIGGHGSIGFTVSILPVVRGRVTDFAIVWVVALHPIPNEVLSRDAKDNARAFKPKAWVPALGWGPRDGSLRTAPTATARNYPMFFEDRCTTSPGDDGSRVLIPNNIAIPPHLIVAPGALAAQVPIHQSNIHAVPGAVLVTPVLVPPAPAILFEWIKKQFPDETRKILWTLYKSYTGGNAPSVGLGPGADPVETLNDVLTFATGKNEEEPPEWAIAQDGCRETEQQSPGNKEYPTDPMVYFMEQMKNVAEDILRPLLAEVPAGGGYELITQLSGSVRSLATSQIFASQSLKAMEAEDAQTCTWNLPLRRIKKQDDVSASEVLEIASELILRTLFVLRRYAQEGCAHIKPSVAQLLRQNLSTLTERLLLPGLLDDSQRRWLAEWCPTPSLLREVTSENAHAGVYLFTVDNQQYVGVSVARDGLAHRCLNQLMNAEYRARADQEKYLRYQAVKQDSILKCYVVAQSHGGHSSAELELLETVVSTLARSYTEENMDTLMTSIGKFGADWTKRLSGLNGTFPFVVNGTQAQLAEWGRKGAIKSSANRIERRTERSITSLGHMKILNFESVARLQSIKENNGYPGQIFTFNDVRFVLSKHELVRQLGSHEEAAKVIGTESFVSVHLNAPLPLFPGSEIGLNIQGKNWGMWFQRDTEIRCLKQLWKQLITAGLIETTTDDLGDTSPEQLNTDDSGAEEVVRKSWWKKRVADAASREADDQLPPPASSADVDSGEDVDEDDNDSAEDVDDNAAVEGEVEISEDEFPLETFYGFNGESTEGGSDWSSHDCGWSSESSDAVEESVNPRKRRRVDMSDEMA
ncbi:hypothetical protein HDU89_006767 [Geranomyces variabilis]|nr:hypothetical protein HDU89_006767 [Geranomyces variabilis]